MDDESTCDDDPQELARKGYIHQSRQKKSKGYAQSTLERIKQKKQNVQQFSASGYINY